MLGNIGLNDEDKYETGGVRLLEIGRYRSTVHGVFDDSEDSALIARAEVVKAQLEASGSELDRNLNQVRLAALTGGIARLHVIGASNAEVKERRDRAEDAICAVRGALKDGCLPGGCWTLLRLAYLLADSTSKIDQEILIPALHAPLHVLLDNVGMRGIGVEANPEFLDTVKDLENSAKAYDDSVNAMVFDANAGEFVNALDAGILDSLPAVRDALGNAISIATQHGTLGAVIVQPRDHQVELTEARDASDWHRSANVDENEADRRGF
jgi:chaperonin GroEL